MGRSEIWQMSFTGDMEFALLDAYDDDGGDDAPLIPEVLERIIPDFSEFGSVNCKDHLGETKRETQSCLGADKQVTWRCVCCRTVFGQPTMHLLPCRHLICRDCLNTKVLGLHKLIFREDSNTDPTSLQESSELPLTPSAASKDSVEALEALAARCKVEFTCCGQYMNLERYMLCMESRRAEEYWLGFQFMTMPKCRASRKKCAWPDCRAFISPACFFESNSFVRAYCVMCKANSLMLGDGDDDLRWAA